MSMPLILGCLWVLVAAATAMLPMRRQMVPGLALLVAAPVLLQADSYTAVDNMREFWGRTLRFLRDFCIIILVSGALRELLRHNTLLGLPVAMSIRTEAAEQPFFGLILSGFLLAVLRAVEATLRRAIHRRRQAETVGKEAEA